MAHQTYSTYSGSLSALKLDNESNKVLLATVEFGEQVTGWSLSSASVYGKQVSLYSQDLTPVSVTQSLTALTSQSAASSLASNDQYFYNRGTGELYIRVAVDPTNNVIILTRRHHVATEPISANDVPGCLTSLKVYYEPRLLDVSAFTQDRGEPFESINIHSRGNLSLINGDGFYDELMNSAFFDNKEVKVYSSSKLLTQGQEQFLGGGRTVKKDNNDTEISISFEDFFENLNKINIPLPGSTTPFDILRDPVGVAAAFIIEPDGRSKNPRYIYGRLSDVFPINENYANDPDSITASVPNFNREWNLAAHPTYLKDSIITSVTSDSQFYISGTDGSLLTVGADLYIYATSNISFPNQTSTSNGSITSLATQGSGQVLVTVDPAFTAGFLATGVTIGMSGLQKLILRGSEIRHGGTWAGQTRGGTSNPSTPSSHLQLRRFTFSPEASATSKPFRPGSDELYISTVFGKTSITASGYTAASDLIEWPGEIMIDLLGNVLSFTSDNINTASFLSADSIRVVQIGLKIPYSKKDTTMKTIDIMQDIQKSALGQFRLGRSNKLEYFVWDSITASQDILTTVTLPLTDKDFLQYNEYFETKNLNQRVRLFYNHKEKGDSFSQINQIATASQYLFSQSERIKEIKTLIYSSSTAESISALYSVLYKNPWKMIQCKVKLQAADLFVGDRILVHKSKKIQPVYRGMWTSIGASSYAGASSLERERHGYWKYDAGGVLDDSGSTVSANGTWMAGNELPIKKVFTNTSEIFEVLSITKDGFQTNLLLTNYGGGLMRSTTTAALGQ